MEHYKQKTLPDKFKAISQKGWAYTCNRTSRDTYSVRWNAQGGGEWFADYTETTLKEIIFRDKEWKILTGSEGVKEDLLEAIKQFCKEGSVRAVLFNAAGFKVYSESIAGPVFVVTEDKLLDVMKAVTLIESCYN